ncbi:MAG: hypothetical protein RML12_02935 [Xanthomonadales bacterium]|nr:hypothetical protein [Xanthomonadales bacterium]
MTRLDLWLLLARVHASRGDWREAEGAVGEAERLAAEADASQTAPPARGRGDPRLGP